MCVFFSSSSFTCSFHLSYAMFHSLLHSCVLCNLSLSLVHRNNLFFSYLLFIPFSASCEFTTPPSVNCDVHVQHFTCLFLHLLVLLFCLLTPLNSTNYLHMLCLFLSLSPPLHQCLLLEPLVNNMLLCFYFSSSPPSFTSLTAISLSRND